MEATEFIATDFARLSARAARGVLGVALIVAVAAIGISLSPLRSGFADAPDRGPGDLALYNAEIRRIRSGEGYYQAANSELRKRGYPTRSLFNWRTPLPMALLGRLPHPLAGRILLGALSLIAIYSSFTMLEREGSVWQGVGCGLLMIGAFLPCVLPDIYVAPELWSALLITLSLCAYEKKRPSLAVLLGVTALFFRDLAGLYCLLMGLMAAYRRQWRELAAWVVGLIAYSAYFAWHASHVLPLIGANDLAHRGSWLQLGGLPFVLSTCQMNVFLLLTPQWLTALAFTAALLGLAAWNSPIGQRVCFALCGYLALFSAVGHPFNQYWGSLFAPLICIGIAKFPAAIRDLSRRSRILSPLG